jgi:VanZ family protein
MIEDQTPPDSRIAAWVRLATVLQMAVALVGTHFPAEGEPGPEHADKVAHALVYLVIGYFWAASWELSVGRLRVRHFFTLLVAGAVYAAFDEITQIPFGRDCNIYDWWVDLVAIGLGLLAYRATRTGFSKLLHRIFTRHS